MDHHRLLVFVGLLFVASRPAMAAAPSCGIVSTALAPCLSFVKGDDSRARPSDACCAGVKKISELAKSHDDRVAVCNCGKAALSMIGDYDPSLIPLIPQQCGVAIDLPPIDKDFDCSTISLIWKAERDSTGAHEKFTS
ncbi:non-specific lipid-transfer protein-like [Diospyros lotus]|uniref:non-specific lipid-transfer protein-like n=1 Tax=Diospyros lotus TaxID=55363 RepID=UPI002252E14A|nr:non-specific lipid-transfer protein-like [Diospyros lotus]